MPARCKLFILAVCLGLACTLVLPAQALKPPEPKPFSPMLRPGAWKKDRAKSMVPLGQQVSDSRAKLYLARILGWIRDYDQSLEVYSQILSAHPDNWKARREAARTAYWAKRNELGNSLYRQLFTPPVDALLAQRLAQAAERSASQSEARRIRELIPQDPQATVFQGFEALLRLVEHPEAGLPAPIRTRAGDILDDLRTKYVRHKQAWLEYRAKQSMWNKRFIPAMHRLQELVGLEPTNQEAWFDLAQTQCVLGLCDQEAKTYSQLVDLAPKHNLARRALKRQEIRSSPALAVRYSLWDEQGRGELSQMHRQRTDMYLEVPLLCRHSLGLTLSRHWEDPQRHAEEVRANSLRLQGRIRLNAFWSGDFALRLKDYQDSVYASQETGHLGVHFNAWDMARLQFRFARENLLPNAFALAQGIYADTWRAEVTSHLTHALSAAGGGQYVDYSDHNKGVQTDLALGYALTEHPRELKITVSGEYRDTAQESREIWNQQNTVTDIVHPYWTPQDYLGTALTLQWRHDLSDFQFCGTQEHVYDMQLTAGTDTDSNPSIELKGTYTLDFTQHWRLELEGMLHESQDWDAQSVLAGVRYRF
ncbi:MAG: hypothetical protein R6V55_10930 [Desulfovermiculus sp.]